MLLDNLFSCTQRTEITAKNENQQLVSKTYVARSDYMQYVLLASNKYKYNKIYTVTVPKQLLCIIHNTIFHNHRISLCTQATSTVMVKPGWTRHMLQQHSRTSFSGNYTRQTMLNSKATFAVHGRYSIWRAVQNMSLSLSVLYILRSKYKLPQNRRTAIIWT